MKRFMVQILTRSHEKSQNFVKKKNFPKLKRKIREFTEKKLPQVPKRENLCTTNLPPEVKREQFVSYKFITGGNTWISSMMNIYHRRQRVIILYTANLPPEAMLENITLVILLP